MTDAIDFREAFDETIKSALREFVAWCVENWLTTEAEAQTLTNPVADPASYARGYCEAFQSVPDALDCWLDGVSYP